MGGFVSGPIGEHGVQTEYCWGRLVESKFSETWKTALNSGMIKNVHVCNGMHPQDFFQNIVQIFHLLHLHVIWINILKMNSCQICKNNHFTAYPYFCRHVVSCVNSLKYWVHVDDFRSTFKNAGLLTSIREQ